MISLSCGVSSSVAYRVAPFCVYRTATPANVLLCATCHGRTGDLGMNGAKDLVTSTIPRDEAIAVITSGRAGMMAYGTMLSKKEIAAVTDHVLTLRTKSAR